MSRKYAAFISYRHLPLDTKVAEKLHKSIERYRIPKELRPGSGGKNLGLVFRDREELPLSNNLTQDIYEALDHSDFLIVVCTPHTPKSLWVRREISHFIAEHGRDRVITVLAAGTPEESIPREITHIYAPDGVTVVDRVEPLCAYLVDKTPGRTLANVKKELLRLVAAMLNCPYDALRQRQKQYRQKQISAATALVAAVALCFAGVLAQKNGQIAEKNQQIAQQLQQTQLQESQALTLLSQARLAQGDRTGALESALLALPGEDTPRPYYAPARTALHDALYLFEKASYRETLQIAAPAALHNVTISEDGSYAMAACDTGQVLCYSLETGECMWSFPQDEYAVDSLHFLPQVGAVLYVSRGSSDYILDLQTGELLAAVDYGTNLYVSDISPDGRQLAMYGWGNVAFCSLPDGEVQWAVQTATASCEGTYSVDGNTFAMLMRADFGAGVEMRLWLFDPQDPQKQQITTLGVWPSKGGGQDQRILALEDGTFFAAYHYDNACFCFRISQTGEVLQSSCFEVPDGSGLLFPPPGEQRQIGKWIYILYKDRLCCLDGQTLAYEGHFSLPEYGETIQLPNEGNIRLFTEDGRLFLREGTTFWEYRVTEELELRQYRQWSCGADIAADYWCGENPQLYAVVTTEGTLQVLRCVGGAGTQAAEPLSVTLSGNFPYLSAMCGVLSNPAGTQLLIRDVDGAGTRTQQVLDLQSGTVTPVSGLMPGQNTVFDADGHLTGVSEGAVPEGAVWASVHSDDQIPGQGAITAALADGVLHWWLDGRDPQQTRLPQDIGEDPVSMTVGQNGLVVLYQKASGAYWIYDTSGDTWQQGRQEAVRCIRGAKTKPWVAFADENGDLHLYDGQSGQLQLSVPQAAYDCCAMKFLREDTVLLVVHFTGRYTVFNTETGQILGSFIGELSSQGRFGDIIVRESSDGEYVYITSCNAEVPGLMVRGYDWVVDRRITGMVDYLYERNAILCLDETAQQLLCYPVPSLEELMTMGWEILRG